MNIIIGNYEVVEAEMIKRILILWIMVALCAGCGTSVSNNDEPVSGTAEQKKLLQQYIKETQPVIINYNKAGESIKNNISDREIRAKKYAEVIDTTRKDLHKIKIPDNCPQAKKLSKLRDRRLDLIDAINDYAMGNTIIAGIALLLGKDKDMESEIVQIDKQMDEIYAFAEMRRDTTYSESGDYCEELVTMYLDWYMREEIPVDVNEREKCKNELKSIIAASSCSEGINVDKIFDDSTLDAIINERHKAIMGRLGNDNTTKKERLFELQDNMYKKFKYEITSEENEDEVAVKVEFFPIDKEKAQAMYDNYFSTEAKKEYPKLFTDGMDCIQLKSCIDEQEANDTNKIKTLVNKVSDGAMGRDVVPDNVYEMSMELQKMMNDYGTMTDTFLAIQEDSVLAAYEQMELSSNPREYIFHFRKNNERGGAIPENQFNNKKEIWKELDGIFWGIDSSSGNLLPVKVDSSYFKTGR